jgi:lipid-A-disaccharide synthase
MLQVSTELTNYQYIVAGAPSISKSFYDSLLVNYPNVRLISGQTYPILAHSEAALVTSGTATLETALFKVPEIVCYKGSAISFAIAKKLVKVKYISLVNLIADREVVKELIQSDLTKENLLSELSNLLESKKRAEMLFNYKILIEQLGEKGASKRAADIIDGFLRKEKKSIKTKEID